MVKMNELTKKQLNILEFMNFQPNKSFYKSIA